MVLHHEKGTLLPLLLLLLLICLWSVFCWLQVGLGRTGRLWGHEHYGVEPDIMTLAKPLAGELAGQRAWGLASWREG